MSMFSTILKQTRTKKGISQSEFAKRLGVSRNTIINYESGKSAPTVDVLRKMSDILGVNGLLGFEEWDFVEDDEGELHLRYLNMFDLEREYGFTSKDIDQKMSLDYAFVSLNAEGRAEAVKRIQELTMLPKYAEAPIKPGNDGGGEK